MSRCTRCITRVQRTAPACAACSPTSTASRRGIAPQVRSTAASRATPQVSPGASPAAGQKRARSSYLAAASAGLSARAGKPSPARGQAGHGVHRTVVRGVPQRKKQGRKAAQQQAEAEAAALAARRAGAGPELTGPYDPYVVSPDPSVAVRGSLHPYYAMWPVIGPGPVPGCDEMAPAEERAQRVQQRKLHPFEQPLLSPAPGSIAAGRALVDLVVKRHARSAAGMHGAGTDPATLRTPAACVATLDYLWLTVCGADGRAVDPRFADSSGMPQRPSFADVHEFIFNRSRAVRRDFVSMNYRHGARVDSLVLQLHEEIARYHIMAHATCAGHAGFEEGLNTTELNNTLKTLLALYDYAALRTEEGGHQPGLYSPSEAECRVYHLIVTLSSCMVNGDLIAITKTMQHVPARCRQHSAMRWASQVVSAVMARAWARLPRLFQTAPSVLYAAVLSLCLPPARKSIIAQLNASYHPTATFSAAQLQSMLMTNSAPEAVQWALHNGMQPATSEGDSNSRRAVRIAVTPVPGASKETVALAATTQAVRPVRGAAVPAARLSRAGALPAQLLPGALPVPATRAVCIMGTRWAHSIRAPFFGADHQVLLLEAAQQQAATHGQQASRAWE